MGPNDRVRAIELLLDYHTNMMYSHSNGIDTRKLLMCGFKGFAAFSDAEVIRALHQIRDQDFRAAEILRDMAEFELLK